jgi:hypothetical protein
MAPILSGRVSEPGENLRGIRRTINAISVSLMRATLALFRDVGLCLAIKPRTPHHDQNNPSFYRSRRVPGRHRDPARQDILHVQHRVASADVRSARRLSAVRGDAVKMSELIAAVGDENVRFQNLDQDAHTVDKTKHGTKISFYTDAIQAEELLGGGKTEKIGLVLWLPRDRVDAAIAAAKAGTTAYRKDE